MADIRRAARKKLRGFRGPGEPEQSSGRTPTGKLDIPDYSRTIKSPEQRQHEVVQKARKKQPVRYYQAEKKKVDKRIPSEED
jgi:hypothetical protein